MFSHSFSSAVRTKLRQSCAGTADPRLPARCSPAHSSGPEPLLLRVRVPTGSDRVTGSATRAQRAAATPCSRCPSAGATPGSPASAVPGSSPPAAFGPRGLCRAERAGALRAAAKSRGRCLVVSIPRAARGLRLPQPPWGKVLSWCPSTARPVFPHTGHKSSSGERGMHPVLPKPGWPLGAGNSLPVPGWPCRPPGPGHDAEGSGWSRMGYFCHSQPRSCFRTGCHSRRMQRDIPWES